MGKTGKRFLEHLADANNDANPELMRLALKLATGAGKTTVMAMIIAWQTINAVRQPGSSRFTRGFLVVTPGLTIRDRLRVLQPNDPDSYYKDRELVPGDMLGDLDRAKIVITNYHAFKLRERVELSKGGRSLLQGRGEELNTLETEGQMIQRVMPDLMGLKNILVLNDEAHHCYREKPEVDEIGDLKGDDKEEAEKNNEAARLWISGLEIVKRKLGITRVMDLSATPFFLRGSGYAEGTLFPWTMSDFSLMDAIECGIVKLPRVPVADNIPGGDMPKFRNLWEHIRAQDAQEGPRQGGDSRSAEACRSTADHRLEALYGHYEKTYADCGSSTGSASRPASSSSATTRPPPSWSTTTSPASIATNEDGSTTLENGRLALFRNFDEHGNPLARPDTLLIDSEQIESGDALDDNFRGMAADEIDRFRREIIERTGDRQQAENITDQELLREVMNTVGKQGRLGESIRCVVSVSMLTEGWDANTVTHVLGVRAFGTQLLCEQVIGRALRRQSYDLNEDRPVQRRIRRRAGHSVRFHRQAGDRAAAAAARDHPGEGHPPRPRRARNPLPARRRLPRRTARRAPHRRVQCRFHPGADSRPGRPVHHARTRASSAKASNSAWNTWTTCGTSTLLFHLTKRLIYTKWRDAGEDPKLHLFGQLKRITKQWLDTCLVCKGGTYPAQLMYQELADMACERITAAITRTMVGDSARSRPCSTPTIPIGSTATSSSTRRARIAGRPTRAGATSTG